MARMTLMGAGGGGKLVSTAGLAAFWTLDEATGTTRADSSGHGNNLSDNNSVTQVPGVSASTGNAAGFNGTTQYLGSIADNSFLKGNQSITIAIWAKFASTSGFQTIVGKSQTGQGSDYVFSYSGGTLKLGIGNGSASKSFTPTVGTWYFFLASLDLTGAKLASVSVNLGAATTGSVTSSSGTGAAFMLGADLSGAAGAPNNFFNGSLDSAGFWDRLLTASEQTALYNNGNGVTWPLP